MKFILSYWKLLLLFVAPIFILSSCSKDDDDDLQNTNEFVTYNIAGQSGTFTAPADSVITYRQGNETFISASLRAGNNSSVFISLEGAAAPGNYSARECGIGLINDYYFQGPTPTMINITAYGAVGGYIIGSYSGTLRKSADNTPAAVSGTFRIKRR